MGRLTTHVLDVASGKPASGMKLTLQEIDGDSRREVCEITTNADGRADEPLLDGDAFRVGVWELAFNVADYFVATDVAISSPPFLDVVRIRFGISASDENYHVPLLVTPWSYSTYRGS